MKRVEFFFDLSSPYSYLAATQIEAIAARAGAEVAWRPFVLAAVFKAAQNVMPASSPPKAKWMFRDLQRWAAHYQVPFQFASRFPINAIRAERLLLVGERADPSRLGQLVRAAFHAVWVDDRDVTDDAVLRSLASEFKLDPDAALAAIEDPEIKSRLREHTDEAIRRGAFGAPAMFVGEELFWGNDRLEFVEAALRA